MSFNAVKQVAQSATERSEVDVKRSDMIRIIASTLEMQDIINESHLLQRAEQILDIIEYYKMLPPERQVDPKKKLGASGPLKYYVNDWEDEDACMG